jgi:hypothetical protein
MTTFTQSQLFDALEQYVQNRDALVEQASASVVELRFANEVMFGLLPLFDEIGFRGDNQWYPASRTWLPEKPATTCYEHGFDSAGRIRIIRNGPLTILFTYQDQIVDELLIRGRDAAPQGLKRYLVESGRTTAAYQCLASPQQYHCETFQYDQGKLLQSEQKTWYVKDGQWVEASWVTRHLYEYDSVGLIRVFRDIGEASGGKELVYVRPKWGRLCKQNRSRRPFVAYTIHIEQDCSDPQHLVYSDAYGLEMNINDEWPIDTVLLAPPALVRVITGDTGVLSMGTVYAGAASLESKCDLRKLKKSGGKWALLDAEASNVQSMARSVLDANLSVILSVTNPSQVSNLLAGCKHLTSERIVVAIRSEDAYSPDTAQSAALEIRNELHSLNSGQSRVIVDTTIEKLEVLDFVEKPDIDGVLYRDGTFASALKALVPIALES